MTEITAWQARPLEPMYSVQNPNPTPALLLKGRIFVLLRTLHFRVNDDGCSFRLGVKMESIVAIRGESKTTTGNGR
jgi:hypothetical protein